MQILRQALGLFFVIFGVTKLIPVLTNVLKNLVIAVALFTVGKETV